MKSLKESLFDTDLATRKLPIEKYMDDFSSYALEKLDPTERNTLFDILFESGKICNAAELRKDPIDLTKNIIMVRRDGLKGLTEASYPCKYDFIYSIHALGDRDKTFAATLQDASGGKYYYWDNEELYNVEKKPSWKGKVSEFYNPNSSYSVVTNEKWVKEIIDGILLD